MTLPLSMIIMSIIIIMIIMSMIISQWAKHWPSYPEIHEIFLYTKQNAQKEEQNEGQNESKWCNKYVKKRHSGSSSNPLFDCIQTCRNNLEIATAQDCISSFMNQGLFLPLWLRTEDDSWEGTCRTFDGRLPHCLLF